MSRHCSLCRHSRRKGIEKALSRGRSIRQLAQKYALTKSAIHRDAHHPEDPEMARILRSLDRPLPDWLLSGKPRPVRGNPDKTKPYRCKPGQSGNPHGRPPAHTYLAEMASIPATITRRRGRRVESL